MDFIWKLPRCHERRKVRDHLRAPWAPLAQQRSRAATRRCKRLSVTRLRQCTVRRGTAASNAEPLSCSGAWLFRPDARGSRDPSPTQILLAYKTSELRDAHLQRLASAGPDKRGHRFGSTSLPHGGVQGLHDRRRGSSRRGQPVPRHHVEAGIALFGHWRWDRFSMRLVSGPADQGGQLMIDEPSLMA